MSKKLSVLFLLVASFVCEGSANANPDVWRKAVRSTVWIVTDTGSGSGVVVEKKDEKLLIATAYHVVEGASEVRCLFPKFDSNGSLVTDRTVYASDEELKHQAIIRKEDARRDLALLEVTAPSGDIEVMQRATEVRPGEELHFIGNSSTGPLFGYTFGHARGVVSASTPEKTLSDPMFRRPLSSGLFQTVFSDRPIEAEYVVADAPVNEGDSGGPAVFVDENGNVVLAGLTQGYSSGRLVSTLVSVRELTALLEEADESQDLRLEETLRSLQLDYTPGTHGEFLVPIEEALVSIESECQASGSGATRRISALITEMTDYGTTDLSRFFLKANSCLKRGRFEIRDSMVWFSVETPADADPEDLRKDLMFVTESAARMASEVVQLQIAEPSPYSIPLPQFLQVE